MIRKVWRWLFPKETCAVCGEEYSDDRWHIARLTHYVGCLLPLERKERQRIIEADPNLTPKRPIAEAPRDA